MLMRLLKKNQNKIILLAKTIHAQNFSQTQFNTETCYLKKSQILHAKIRKAKRILNKFRFLCAALETCFG